jgi:membrane-associated protease RseP (regulator of RpoE activity)
MFAFPAAKRTFVLIMSIALLATAATVQAGEDRGYLGVLLQDLTPSMAKALQMGDKSGVMINDVIDESPAEKAGLEDGDVILEFDGKAISDNKDLVKAVRAASPGDKIEVVVLRSGKNKSLEVEIGKHEDKNFFIMSGDDDLHGSHFEHFGEGDHKVIVMSDDEDFTWTVGKDMPCGLDSDRGYMGVHLDDLNEQMGEYFGVEDGKGALVTEVVEDSPAAKAGLKAGDVIVMIGDNEINSSMALLKTVAKTEPEQQMAVKIVRKGKSKNLSITLGEVPEDAFSKQLQIIGEDGDHFSIHTAPRMMKHFGHDYDADLRMTRRGIPHSVDELRELEEIQEAKSELREMREELDKMREDLKEMQKEQKK